MKNETKTVLRHIAVLMCTVGVILFFINLFDGSMDDSYFLRVKIFCGLMVGAIILSGIAKAAGNSEDDSQTK